MSSIEIYDLWLANVTNPDWIIVPHKLGAIKAVEGRAAD